jgi:membrane carboxypeptidase/penicillin-binding protein
MKRQCLTASTVPKTFRHLCGRIIVREALKRSLNIFAVKILDMTGYSLFFDYLEKGLDLNISDMSSRFKKTLSMRWAPPKFLRLKMARLHCYLVNVGRLYPAVRHPLCERL